MPKLVPGSPTAGYRLEGVYVPEQHYEQIAEREALRVGKGLDDRNVSVLWDWRPLGTRRFEVLLELRVEAIQAAPESARARIIGIFEAIGDNSALPLPNFIKFNAPAILFPFAREVISSMTGKGPNGAFHLNPVNIPALLGHMDVSITSGSKYLDRNEEAAKQFGLEYRETGREPVERPQMSAVEKPERLQQATRRKKSPARKAGKRR